MISRTLGTSSRKFARLRERHPDVGLFAQALYPLLVASSDDFGRIDGDAFSVKHSVWSTAPEPESVFDAALDALHAEALILRYRVGADAFVQVIDFERHQTGLHKRTESRFPAPPDILPEVPGNSGSREENRTEENRREENKNSSSTPAASDSRFESFWLAYPKRVGKDDARKAFAKRKVSDELLSVMLAAIGRQARSDQWRRDNGQYIPNPSTWLNQGRWQDEAPKAGPTPIGAARSWTPDDCTHPDRHFSRAECEHADRMTAFRAGRATA